LLAVRPLAVIAVKISTLVDLLAMAAADLFMMLAVEMSGRYRGGSLSEGYASEGRQSKR
jgi:hypothetical protein